MIGHDFLRSKMLKWSVSSLSTTSQQNSEDVENTSIDLCEKERLKGVIEKTDEGNDGRVTENYAGEKNGGEAGASQLPAFRGRNYLVGGNFHILPAEINMDVNKDSNMQEKNPKSHPCECEIGVTG